MIIMLKLFLLLYLNIFIYNYVYECVDLYVTCLLV
jgi:hypothetical protein